MSETEPSCPAPAAASAVGLASSMIGAGESPETSEERAQRLRQFIADNLPPELRKMAFDLMESVNGNTAVAERFDAFCVQAFSKPDWAAPASAFIAELFENHEDRLAELARVPDLIIELACGQAAVSCTVASKWATRGETHRLSRLAESIIAAQGTMKNAAAVEVMLALAATLAITRPSRAEQLFNTAMPQANAEHAESLADARGWIAAGRSLASAPQDIRDLWDMRLRRPRVPWKWDSAEERKALLALAEYFDPSSELAPLLQKIVPGCWWDLVQQKAASEQALRAEFAGLPPPAPAKDALAAVNEEAIRRTKREWSDDDEPLGVRPHASSAARFILGWACGVILMTLTFLVSPEGMLRFLKSVRELFFPGSNQAEQAFFSPANGRGAAAEGAPVPVRAGNEWRKFHAQNFACNNVSISHFFARVKVDDWSKNQMILSGLNPDLPFADERYLRLLVWLHLDPPQDAETRRRLPKLLLDRAGVSTLSIWEGLCYPGSPNEAEIRLAAREACAEKPASWSAADTARLCELAQAGGKK